MRVVTKDGVQEPIRFAGFVARQICPQILGNGFGGGLLVDRVVGIARRGGIGWWGGGIDWLVGIDRLVGCLRLFICWRRVRVGLGSRVRPFLRGLRWLCRFGLGWKWDETLGLTRCRGLGGFSGQGEGQGCRLEVSGNLA
jgi:hypothetical protein